MTVPEPLDDELFPADADPVPEEHLDDYDEQVRQIMQVNDVSKSEAERQIDEHGRQWAHKHYAAYWRKRSEWNR